MAITGWVMEMGRKKTPGFHFHVCLSQLIFTGTSLYAAESLPDSQISLMYSGDCGSRLCYLGKLNSFLRRKRQEKRSAVKIAGGAGMILANTAESGEELTADSHLVTATMVEAKAGDQIRDYIKNLDSPTATISFLGTLIRPSPLSPRVAAFSSRELVLHPLFLEIK
ncbi:hypothetical protein EUTSA_v10009783mg [Eutrema salsugineum]|uniref:PA domain-containing protein n=1 Tax=Eutrema salsugineum TaxID=72664 RepID=V4KR02_EUTSA|nr:hypothetical protein EUTSA_v10009783mg [Eutrema salsugineum]